MWLNFLFLSNAFLFIQCVREGVPIWYTVMTLCNLVDYTVHLILQHKILEWVATPFSRGSSQHRD